jgi:Zn-finger nucleic acid-binding protein
LTISQVRHVLGDRIASKILRLLKLSSRQSEHHCPFCEQPMKVLNTPEPPLELDACRQCSTVWFDVPTYEALPQMTFETTNSITMQATEIIALERLKELKERQEEERKKARKRKGLHRSQTQREDAAREGPGGQSYT